MKFIAYSDPHIHPHQRYSKVLPDGMNSRLVDTIKVVDKIYADANELKMPVISGGDTFQVKGSVNVIAYNEMARIVTKRSYHTDALHPDIICIGNHDAATHDGSRHALEPLATLPGIIIPTETHTAPHFVYYSDESILFTVISYPMEHGRFSEDKFQAQLNTAQKTIAGLGEIKTKILVSHLFTHELMRAHLDRDGDFSAKELIKIFDLTLLGHYHIHHVIDGPKDHLGRPKKVVSIGSPIQITAAERGEKKGYLIIDTDTFDVELVPIESPGFHFFEGEKTIIPEKIAGDFVTVKVKSKAESTRVATLLERAGVAEYRIEIIPVKKTARIDLAPGAKDEEIIDKYIGSEWGKTELDASRLKATGIKYLS